MKVTGYKGKKTLLFLRLLFYFSSPIFFINGPTFLIEFDNAGGPRGSANHIHTIWREKGNEFGEDILKKHYLEEKH